MSNPEAHAAFLKKLVSAAKAIISYQVGLPIGCLRISKIISWLEPYQNVNFPVFSEYLTATLGLPMGTERLHWDTKALKKYDKKLNKINSKFQERVFDACYRIIDELAD